MKSIFVKAGPKDLRNVGVSDCFCTSFSRCSSIFLVIRKLLISEAGKHRRTKNMTLIVQSANGLSFTTLSLTHDTNLEGHN
jgi:hypothetical protein